LPAEKKLTANTPAKKALQTINAIREKEYGKEGLSREQLKQKVLQWERRRSGEREEEDAASGISDSEAEVGYINSYIPIDKEKLTGRIPPEEALRTINAIREEYGKEGLSREALRKKVQQWLGRQSGKEKEEDAASGISDSEAEAPGINVGEGIDALGENVGEGIDAYASGFQDK
jgi:hypothetical protein